MDAGSRYKRMKDEVADLAHQAGRDPNDITLIAVSKTEPIEAILEVYNAGCRDVGESRVQEALPKQQASPKDLRWHFIGTLQANKVRKVIGKFALIHSVDSVDLVRKISAVSDELGLTTDILLQVNISGEDTKHGLSVMQWKTAMPEVLTLPAIRLQGLMTMAPLTEDKASVRSCFAALRTFRDELKASTGKPWPHLSMGMSHDYPLAIQEGATLLRVGTALFGPMPSE